MTISAPLKTGTPSTPAPPLAIDGGRKAVTVPARDRWKRVHLRDAIPILKLMRQGRTSNSRGSGVIGQFERDFAKMAGAKFGLTMNNGTAAIHSALFALGVGPGDEVILPAYTWHATASAVRSSGATPVFCDVDPRTLTADPNDIAARITPRTKVILVVHIWGNPAEMDRIKAIADEHRLKLVEDCSHAHGSSYQDRPIGSWGDIGCFSLQGTKPVTGGEAGIAVCSDPRLFDNMLVLGHPIRVATEQKTNAFDTGQMNLGPKYRAHLFAIVLAECTLRRLPRLNELRRRNWQILCQELAGCEIVKPVETLPGAVRGGFNEFKMVLSVGEPGFRDRFVKAAAAEGAEVSADRYHFLHEVPIYQRTGAITLADLDPIEVKPAHWSPLPNLESLRDRIISLPAFADVREEAVRQCARALVKVASHGSGLATR